MTNEDVPSAEHAPTSASSLTPKRLRAGERRLQVLQALATMLQAPQACRITTAALAAELGVSEAALYRHFASKAQMFDALIEFVDSSLTGMAHHIIDGQAMEPEQQISRLVGSWLRFAQRNPGLCRVMLGEVLVGESPKLQARMERVLDRMESVLRQAYRGWAQQLQLATPSVFAQERAALALGLVMGQLQRFSRSQFQRLPTEHEAHLLALLLSVPQQP